MLYIAELGFFGGGRGNRRLDDASRFVYSEC